MIDLERFVQAQQPVYPTVLAELGQGRKRSHWIWYIFPQLAALGFSSTSKFYGLATLADADAYLAHPLLGPRLIECTGAMLVHGGHTALAILGSPDDMKFQSSMTLFARVPDADPLFDEALGQFFGGVADPRTLALIDRPY